MNGNADKLDEQILKFLEIGSCYGYGHGSGEGEGDGEGDGYGYGSGEGDGHGEGYGYGHGSGEGDGSGDGSGYGYGYGSGEGDGHGEGYGYGHGSGEGDGYGYGSGSGEGDGSGDGSGYGYGSGDMIKSFNSKKVFVIDGVNTLIDSIHRMYAKGNILNKDLTTTPIYVARVGNSFAHGATLREAQRDAQAKDMERRPIEQRLEAFVKAHPHTDVCYDGKDLYEWHHVLTGSCKAGRDAWCNDRGLNPDKDEMTVARFIELTKDSYGGEIIGKLAKMYENK